MKTIRENMGSIQNVFLGEFIFTPADIGRNHCPKGSSMNDDHNCCCEG